MHGNEQAHRAASAAGRSLIREQHGEAAVLAALRAAVEGRVAPPQPRGQIPAVA